MASASTSRFPSSADGIDVVHQVESFARGTGVGIAVASETAEALRRSRAVIGAVGRHERAHVIGREVGVIGWRASRSCATTFSANSVQDAPRGSCIGGANGVFDMFVDSQQRCAFVDLARRAPPLNSASWHVVAFVPAFRTMSSSVAFPRAAQVYAYYEDGEFSDSSDGGNRHPREQLRHRAKRSRSPRRDGPVEGQGARRDGLPMDQTDDRHRRKHLVRA